MAFVKPFTYVDGAVLAATNHALNEDALREYVNQEVIAADVSADTIVGESIATPRIITTVQTSDFISKTLQGVSKIRLPQEYSWFTATTKSDNQTSNNIKDFQSLNNTGAEVIIYKDNTKVMITFYAKAVGQLNSTVTRGPGNGKWDNKFLLQYEKDGIITQFSGSRSYVWENFKGLNGSGIIDPGAEENACGHRSVMMTRMLTLSAGRYKFSVAVNSKVEKGQINCQTFTIETFHV
jgi:hypothetical protein